MKNIEGKLGVDGKYFLFSCRDDYTQRCDDFNDGDGFELYKFVNGEMKAILTTAVPNAGFLPREEEIRDYLIKKGVCEVYNPSKEIVKEYSGAESYDEPDQDGDMLERSHWCNGMKYPYEIAAAGIRLIGFD